MKRSKCSVSYAVLLVCAASLFFISCPFFGFDPPNDNNPEDETPNSTDAFFVEVDGGGETPLYITSNGTSDEIALDNLSEGFDNSARSPGTYELDGDTDLSVTISWDAVQTEPGIEGSERISVFFSISAGGTNIDPSHDDGVMFELKPAGISSMKMTPGELGGPDWNNLNPVWSSGGVDFYDGKDLTLTVSHNGTTWVAQATDGTTSLGPKDLLISDNEATMFADGVYVYVGLDIGMALTNPLIVKQINGTDLR